MRAFCLLDDYLTTEEAMDIAAIRNDLEQAIKAGSRYCGSQLLAREALELLDEIERLRAALKEIATGDYSQESIKATFSQPTMIWEAVAQRALEQKEK